MTGTDKISQDLERGLKVDGEAKELWKWEILLKESFKYKAALSTQPSTVKYRHD